MEETFVSYDTAMLAESKGFKLRRTTHGYYTNNNYPNVKPLVWQKRIINNWATYHTDVFSQSILQKWLRNVHNIHIIIEPVFDDMNNIEYFGWRGKNKGGASKLGGIGDTYEQALEEGLFKTLELIK